jgi:hypothetical protein
MAVDPDLLNLFTSAELGQGEADLGARLTELYLGCLAEAEVRPARAIFLNSAVFLTTDGSPVLDELRRLEEGGTEIMSCITCLTYHDRMEKVAVGSRAGMRETVEAVHRFPKVVSF